MIFPYIDNEPVEFAGEKFKAEISFSSDLGVGTDLLGLASFFEKFLICFHHTEKYVEVKERR